MDFQFILFPDNLFEGTEAFQARSQGFESPRFISPNVLFAETFIVIEDNDRELLCMVVRPMECVSKVTRHTYTVCDT